MSWKLKGHSHQTPRGVAGDEASKRREQGLHKRSLFRAIFTSCAAAHWAFGLERKRSGSGSRLLEDELHMRDSFLWLEMLTLDQFFSYFSLIKSDFNGSLNTIAHIKWFHPHEILQPWHQLDLACHIPSRMHWRHQNAEVDLLMFQDSICHWNLSGVSVWLTRL